MIERFSDGTRVDECSNRQLVPEEQAPGSERLVIPPPQSENAHRHTEHSNDNGTTSPKGSGATCNGSGVGPSLSDKLFASVRFSTIRFDGGKSDLRRQKPFSAQLAQKSVYFPLFYLYLSFHEQL
jgi:hypothetical protein